MGGKGVRVGVGVENGSGSEWGMMDNSAKSRADDPWRGPVTAAIVGGEAREPGAVW